MQTATAIAIEPRPGCTPAGRHITRTRQDWRALATGTPLTPPGYLAGMVRGATIICETAGTRLIFAFAGPGGDGRRYWLQLSDCLRAAEVWDPAHAIAGRLRHVAPVWRAGIERL